MRNNFKLYFDSRKDAKIFMLSMPSYDVSYLKDFILHEEFRIDLRKSTLEVRTMLTQEEFTNKYMN